MPVPLAGSASRWASGTSARGTAAVHGASLQGRGSGVVGGRPGPQAASSSGRVVDLDTLAEPQAVGHALDLAVLQLGLGDGGVEVDLPQGRGVGLVGQALGQQAQERPLGGRRACSPTVA